MHDFIWGALRSQFSYLPEIMTLLLKIATWGWFHETGRKMNGDLLSKFTIWYFYSCKYTCKKEFLCPMKKSP